MGQPVLVQSLEKRTNQPDFTYREENTNIRGDF